MMNYFLNDLRDWLILEGEEPNNISIDYYLPNVPNQIFLTGTGGQIEAGQKHSSISFQIMVTSSATNRQSAQIKSKQIYYKLQNKIGKLVNDANAVHFLGILANGEPSLLNTTSNGLQQYTTLYTSNIREPDILIN